MTTEAKLDLYKRHKDQYVASKKPVLLEIAPARYLSIEGVGDPGGSAFQIAVGALYGMAFTVKMTRKMAGKGDYAVCKLEAQWWHPAKTDFALAPKDEWCWRLMIRTPEFVEDGDLIDAASKLKKKKKGDGVERVALETIDERRCVQMLHVGPYEREHETLAEMRSFAAQQGARFHGLHHEIYLSDPRRVAPEKLRTILRHPVK